MSYIKGETGDWEIVLGLEVHAQVISEAKLFSGAPTTFGADPNTQVSLVDAAMPGMLPVINERCVEQAVRTGLGLNAQINLRSIFDRKNYFYQDLPQGYQISQYKDPIVGEGVVEIDLDGGVTKKIGITKLRAIVRYLGTCDGNMDEGSMRCDVNVSVRKPGSDLGTRCEIKNVNSIRFVKQAIEYEARRQVEIIEDGGKIVQETRLFDPGRGETRSMRSKEDAQDYRYFPDPDLLPLVLTQEYVDGIRKTLPELPDARKARFIKEYGLTPYDAGVLVLEKETAALFDTVAKGRDAKEAVKLVTGDFFAMLNRRGATIAESPITAEHLGKLLDLQADGTISGRIAKDLFVAMEETGKDPATLVEERGLRQVTDTGAIEAAIKAVIEANPGQVTAYRAKPTLMGWFVGQVMKSTGGKANPKIVNELLKKALDA